MTDQSNLSHDTPNQKMALPIENLMRALRGGYGGSGALLIVASLIFVLFAVLMPGQFLQITTLQAMAFQLPELGLLSLAMTIVLISGGLNLSIIATANQSALLMVWLMNLFITPETAMFAEYGWIFIALTAGLLICIAIGLINGVLVALVGVHPILATLGTMTLINGIDIYLTNGATLSGLPAPVLAIGNSTIFFVPISFFVFLAAVLAISFLLNQTPLGVRIRMIGSNLEAARFSGVNTTGVLIRVYVLSSVLCWLAAVVMMARFNSAAANFAESYLLITVLAAILGGIDPYGGFGKISGLFIALIVLQMLSSGFNLLGLDVYLSIASWSLILLAVIALRRLAVGQNSFGKRRKARSSLKSGSTK